MLRSLKTAILAGALSAGALSASAAPAALVDFNGLPEGDAANPYSEAGATFSTAGGFNVIATVSGTRMLCPATVSGSAAVCTVPLEVSFAAPAYGISFGFAANNITRPGADIGDVALFSGATLLGTVDMLVLDSDFLSLDLVNLAGFSGVTRMVLTTDDFGGLLYDDFSFTLRSAVPEPASWALMIGGFALVGSALRRRRPVLGLA